MEKSNIKASLVTVLILDLAGGSLREISEDLQRQVESNKHFFQDAPVILDVTRARKLDQPADYAVLKTSLSNMGLITVAIRGGTEQQIKSARLAGLPNMASTQQQPDQVVHEEIAPTPAAAPEPVPSHVTGSKIITQPVRSGSQIYARGTDLVILSSVSPGAEIIADGNIHVYGTLKGRAIAGAGGDESRMIFCDHLEAELLSIAGTYLIRDQIDTQWIGQKTCIQLNNGNIAIHAIE